MTILTNRHNLPQALIDAVLNDDYDKGESDITATGLIAPPRVVVLRDHHNNEITEDVSERIWALFGQVTHGILERANRIDLAEKRFYIDVDGWKIGGKFDTLTLDGNILSDWKVTSVYKFLGGTAEAPFVPVEFEQQLNILRIILIDNGIAVDKLRIVGLLRDWSKPEAKRRPKDYPNSQVYPLDVPVWEEAKARAFIADRVAIHKAARAAFETNGLLPDCTDTDRWKRPPSWACKKRGAARATKVFYNEKEAKDFAAAKGLEVEYRQGEAVRCMHYCAAAPFCSQWQNDPDNPDRQLEGIPFGTTI